MNSKQQTMRNNNEWKEVSALLVVFLCFGNTVPLSVLCFEFSKTLLLLFSPTSEIFWKMSRTTSSFFLDKISTFAVVVLGITDDALMASMATSAQV